MSVTDELDCYYEPLSPEDQILFDHQTRLEAGDHPDSVHGEPTSVSVHGEPTSVSVHGEPVEPPLAARKQYAATLKQIREAAASEGIPVLPNPLSGTLRKPNIRSP